MIRLKHIVTLTLLAAVLSGPGFVSNADTAPIPACVAGDIIAGDPGCPASGLCTINKIFSVGDGCVLDFGTRNVTIAANGELRIAGATVTLKAGNFTVASGGLVDGTATTVGGSFTVEANGNIAVQRISTTNGRILVNGNGGGGLILLDAGGDITIQGQLLANNRSTKTASGGAIELRSGGDTWITSTGDVDPHGGSGTVGEWAFGGSLDVTADGGVTIDSPIDITGGDGGSMSILAGGNVIIGQKINTTGVGDEGSGGRVDIVAWGDVQINGQMQNDGTGPATTGGYGGDGGEVFIDSPFGDITVRNKISAGGGSPGGIGGDIGLMAQGSIDIQSAGKAVVETTSTEGSGGEISLEARGDIKIDGDVRAGGGAEGGVVDMNSGLDITISGAVDARGMGAGSSGGWVTMMAGLGPSGDLAPTGTGDLTLSGTVDLSGGGCSPEWGCSSAGDLDVVACNITVGTLGQMKATASGAEGEGGTVSLTGRDKITIAGSIDARGGGGFDGSIQLIHPVGTPPTVTGLMNPEGDAVPTPVCTGGVGDPRGCLVPCPLCGNGITEFPETCDDTTGTPVSCDGCSAFCREEDCNDANDCTVDSCDEVLGCLSLELPDGATCPEDGNPCTENVCHSGTCGKLIPGCTTTTTSTTTTSSSTTTQPTTTTTLPPTSTTTTSSTSTTQASTTTTVALPTTTTTLPPTTTTTLPPTTTTLPLSTTTSTTTTLPPTTMTVALPTTTTLPPTTTTTLPPTTTTLPPSTTTSTSTTQPPTTTTVAPTTATTLPAKCGNGIKESEEECDDGNLFDGDCCSSTCQFEPAGAPCEDGDACTTNDTCSGGSCVGGAALDCDDGNICTDNDCDRRLGCLDPKPNTTACPLQPISAKKLNVKVKATKAMKNKLVFLSRSAFDLPAQPDDSPTTAGATLRVRDGGGQDVEFDLPRGSWKARSSKGVTKGFSYKDAKRRNGPCTEVTVKAGKLIKATCKGDLVRLRLPLTEPVQVILRMGNTSYCAAFGKSVAQKSDESFVARAAGQPQNCSAAFYRPGSVPGGF